MKTTPRQYLFGAALACYVTLTLAALAQTTSAPADKDAAAATSPTASTTTQTAAPITAPTATNSTTSSAPAATTPTSAASSAATPPSEPPTPPVAAPATTTNVEDDAKSEPRLRRIDAGSGDSKKTPARRFHGPRIRGGDNARVSICDNASLGKGETADSVVAVCGNATSEGDVADAVVAVLGNAHVTGPVGDSVVAVLGNAYVDAKVCQVVAVFGNVELGPNAEVAGDVVTVLGTVKRDPKSIVHGSIPNVALGGFHVTSSEWLQAYLTECVFKLRPLAIAPHLGWAWGIAIGCLLFYALLALLFRGGVETCIETLQTRPGGSILAALLALLLTPVLFVLLILTGVGIAVVPFLGIALLCATLFGKVTFLAWLGRRITRYFGDGPLAHVSVAVLFGGIIVMALYLIPIAGLIVYKLIGMLGLGVVIYTLLIRSKRERPVAASGAAVPAGVSPAAESVIAGAAMIGGPAVAPAPVAPAVPPIVTAALPRAGFWIRIGALAVDVLVLVVAAILVGFLPVRLHLGPGWLLVLATYGAVMWKSRGTTIGGIVCGLKVVRIDNRPIDWATAIVRALSCFISLIALGLGFIWVVIDDEKQSWHDKIAGTTVVCVRGNVSLI